MKYKERTILILKKKNQININKNITVIAFKKYLIFNIYFYKILIIYKSKIMVKAITLS